MYGSIVVPLDRSSLAEQALPLALGIARRAKARLNLVEAHVLYALEEHLAAWAPYDGARDAECRQREQLYLDATATWASAVSPIEISAHVLPGSEALPETVATSILERARLEQADLIVMTPHARGPVSRLAFGSVTGELIRRAGIPILLAPPGEKPPQLIPEPVLDTMLIPLDGSACADEVIEPAIDLAQLMETSCTLLWVIETNPTAREFGQSISAEKRRAEVYLGHVAERFRSRGLEVASRVIFAPDVAEAIRIESEAQRTDLIALATHGRSGIKRLLLGSVASSLIRSSTAPVLVCHAARR